MLYEGVVMLGFLITGSYSHSHSDINKTQTYSLDIVCYHLENWLMVTIMSIIFPRQVATSS